MWPIRNGREAISRVEYAYMRTQTKNSYRTNLQNTQPPISLSGALTTLVSLITMDFKLGSVAVAVLQEVGPSLQLEQYQVPSGIDWNFKHAAYEKVHRVLELENNLRADTKAMLILQIIFKNLLQNLNGKRHLSVIPFSLCFWKFSWNMCLKD